MDSKTMFGLITSVYNGMFMVFFTCINLIILLLFFKKLLNILFGGEERKNGSYALVTGCDTGFGYAVSYEFNKRNIYVFAGCLSTEGVERLNEDENFKGMAFMMNITNIDDIKNAKNIIEEKVKDKGLWCVLNNAGILEPGPIEWMSAEDMKKTMDVNLWGTVNVTKIMLPLVKMSRGRIVNVTSICGRISSAYLASYCMSKYALEAFSDSLRHEMKPWGVSVHIIEPGNHATDLCGRIHKRWKDLSDIQPKEIHDEYGENFSKNILIQWDELRKLQANPQNVVNAYIHAALSSRPKLRYLIGLDAKIFSMTIGTFSTAIGDFIIRVMFNQLTPDVKKCK